MHNQPLEPNNPNLYFKLTVFFALNYLTLYLFALIQSSNFWPILFLSSALYFFVAWTESSLCKVRKSEKNLTQKSETPLLTSRLRIRVGRNNSHRDDETDPIQPFAYHSGSKYQTLASYLEYSLSTNLYFSLIYLVVCLSARALKCPQISDNASPLVVAFYTFFMYCTLFVGSVTGRTHLTVSDLFREELTQEDTSPMSSPDTSSKSLKSLIKKPIKSLIKKPIKKFVLENPVKVGSKLPPKLSLKIGLKVVRKKVSKLISKLYSLLPVPANTISLLPLLQTIALSLLILGIAVLINMLSPILIGNFKSLIFEHSSLLANSTLILFLLSFICAHLIRSLFVNTDCSTSTNTIFSQISSYCRNLWELEWVMKLKALISLLIVLSSLSYGVWGIVVQGDLGQFLVFFWGSAMIFNVVN